MAGLNEAGDDVAKSRKGLIGALVALVVVALAGGAFVVSGGPDLVAQLITGDANEAPVAPVAPVTPATEEPAESTEPSTPTESVEPTAVTEAPVEAAAADDSDDQATTAQAVTPVAAKPPTTDQQSRMYWEQVWSQDNIAALVRNEFASFTLGSVTKSGSTANIRVTANYRAGSSFGGTMVLRDYSGVWYFSSITRDGHAARTPTGSGDTSIMSTIVSQQASNQTIPVGIVNGGYKKVAINGVTMGSGTATVKITLSGGTAAPATGAITCVSKTIGGEKHWFITSFTKN